MRSVVALAAVLVLGAACELEFTEPLPAGSHLHISVYLRQGPADSIRVGGVLAPGFDAAGTRHGFANDTLYALGSAVAPTAVGRHGRLRYRGRWPLDALGTGDTLRVTPPTIAGGPPAPVLEARLIRRMGSDSLVVAQDAPIELRTSSGGEPGMAVDARQWSLEVRDAGTTRPIVTTRSDGAPPSTIAIPRSWLPDSAGPDLDVRLEIRGSGEQLTGVDDYRITFGVRSALRWRVHLTASEPRPRRGRAGRGSLRR